MTPNGETNSGALVSAVVIMAYRLELHRPVEDEVRRITREQIEKARNDLDQADLREAVHQARRRFKKIRALLRLFRPFLGDIYEQENARFRDAGRLLAPIRDATSVLEAVAVVEEDSGRSFEPAKQGLRRQREPIERDAQHDRYVLNEIRCILDGAMAELQDWSIEADAGAAGLARTYGRGRKEFKAAREDPSPERLHEWRKRTKYHRYHCRLLEKAWRGPLEARAQEAHDLTDLLGDHHDLNELEAVLTENPTAFGGGTPVREVFDCARRHRSELESRALRLGAKLYAETPKALAHRLGGYWRTTVGSVDLKIS